MNGSGLAARFFEQGYLSGVPALSVAEAAEQHARFDSIVAKAGPREWEYKPFVDPKHPLLDWFLGLAGHPRVLDVVESLLGPDLLVRNADVFIKEPGTGGEIQWHLDSARPLEEARTMLTAWIALTPSRRENGALRFLPGSHARQIPGGPADNRSLTLSKEALRGLDLAAAVDNVLEPGQMSAHTFRMVHGSGPNRSPERRFGFAIRFFTPACSPETAECGEAMLVRGKLRDKRFTLRPSFPVGWWQE